jgi:hypothetical protein
MLLEALPGARVGDDGRVPTVVFSRHDVVEPDLLYVSNERAAALLTGQHVTGAPDLVIEIASPGTRRPDETIKRRLYEREGVTEYWVVDPDIDVVRVGARVREVTPSAHTRRTCGAAVHLTIRFMESSPCLADAPDRSDTHHGYGRCRARRDHQPLREP